MTRIALVLDPAEHSPELGPCARPRFEPAEVRAGLAAAGHQLVDQGADVQVIDVAATGWHPEPAAAARPPVVLISLGRPRDPWHSIQDAAERQPFIEPWAADLQARKRAAISRR